MSKFFIPADNRDRIHLDEEHWVDIKAKMSLADHDRFNKSLFQMEGRQQMSRRDRRKLPREVQARMQEEEALLKANFRPSTALLLEINILDWNLPDENGKVLKVTHANIGRLTFETASMLEDEITDRNPTSPMAKEENETS